MKVTSLMAFPMETENSPQKKVCKATKVNSSKAKSRAKGNKSNRMAPCKKVIMMIATRKMVKDQLSMKMV